MILKIWWGLGVPIQKRSPQGANGIAVMVDHALRRVRLAAFEGDPLQLFLWLLNKRNGHVLWQRRENP